MKNLTFIVFNMNEDVDDKERKEAAFKDFDSALEFCNIMVENGVYLQKPAILDVKAFLDGEEEWWFSRGDWFNYIDNEYLDQQYPFENTNPDTLNITLDNFIY